MRAGRPNSSAELDKRTQFSFFLTIQAHFLFNAFPYKKNVIRAIQTITVVGKKKMALINLTNTTKVVKMPSRLEKIYFEKERSLFCRQRIKFLASSNPDSHPSSETIYMHDHVRLALSETNEKVKHFFLLFIFASQRKTSSG